MIRLKPGVLALMAELVFTARDIVTLNRLS